MEVKNRNALHLIQGGTLADVGNDIKYKLDTITLVDHDGDSLDVNLKDINDDFTIFIDPKDVEIAALKRVIEELNDKISKPAVTKHKRKHLTKGEVQDVEAAIAKNVHPNIIQSTYELSQATYWRVSNFKHRFSTPQITK